jgi:hypothetical protein
MRRVRRSITVFAVVLAASAWLAPLGGTAHADDGDGAPINVGPNATVSADYPAIPGSDPATGQLQDHDPDTCRSVSELTCTVIPLTFETPPGFKPYDVFNGVVDVTWDPGANVQSGNSLVGGEDANDLDIFLWFNPYDANDTRYHDGGTALSRSASSQVPEEIKIDASSAQKFLLVVNNSSGVNQGFTVKVTTTYAPFTGVSESTESGFTAPVDLSGDTATGTPAGPATGVRSLPAGPVAAAPGAPASVTPDVGALDPSLAGLSGAGSDSILNTGNSANLFKPAAVVKPPKPVSDLTIFLACGVLPIVLVALGAAWFRRRRPVALTV